MGVLLYTDGVVDAMNPQRERFGTDALLEVMRASVHLTAQDLQSNILGRLRQFMDAEPQFDDITLMIIMRNG